MEFLLFPILWVVVSFGLSLGGWQQLASAYRVASLPPAADVRLLGWAKVGGVSYKNILRVGACPEGLAFNVFFLFRFFHPPLLIPWSAIGRIQSTTSFWSTTYRIALSTGDHTSETFRFTSPTLLSELRPWLQTVTIND
ncbi:MAG: hypothetical protein ACRYG7_11110 [Janthinobacterium lividum]